MLQLVILFDILRGAIIYPHCMWPFGKSGILEKGRNVQMCSADYNQRHFIIHWMIFKNNTSKDKYKSCFGEYNHLEYWVLRSYISNVMMSNYNRPIIGFRAKKMSNIENPAKLVSVTVKDRQLMSLIVIISCFSPSWHPTGLPSAVGVLGPTRS